MKVEVVVVGSPSLTDPYGLCGRKTTLKDKQCHLHNLRGRGGRPGLFVPDSPHGVCGRTATLNSTRLTAEELCESRGGRRGLPVVNSLYGACGRKAIRVRAQEVFES